MTTARAVAPLFSALFLASTGPVFAAVPKSMPEAVPIVVAVPAAQDIPYPGTIGLNIDATDLDRRVYRVTETVPVPQGATSLILQLPEWLPGNHAPRGPINLLADVHFEANGQELEWTRDPLEVYAFHIKLPAGTTAVTARFLHTSPVEPSEGRITMTQEMLNLQWEKMSLYPAGYYVRQIPVKPTVTFPQDWTVFTALDGQNASGNTVTWDTVNYETLVDSPVFAGKFAKSWDVGNGITLDVVADKAEQLKIAPEHLATFNKLTDEAIALFGARHYDHYNWLLALTDRMGGIGLEHQRSSENQYQPNDFVDWDTMAHDRNVTSHELVHSWNGKYRRPAKLWTPDYRQPMQDNLLWMYEGQTQFWGWILAARSGLQPKDVVLGSLANSAGYYSEQPGRVWRSVEDTTHDPIINSRRPLPFSSLSRSEDYYSEGMLVWLEADQIIRQGTRGKKGLDDFAKVFFGMKDGDWGQLTYEFGDIVAALDQVYSYDWATFLNTRLQKPGQPAPVKGIQMAGYQLVWKEEPNPYEAGRINANNYVNLTYSLGINLSADGTVTSTMWDSPAFDAGVIDGTRILAVNGTEYSKDAITKAVTDAKTGTAPIELLVKRGDRFLTVPVDYHGGLRYPWLEPGAKGEQPLDRLLVPRTGK
ncbi:peptidase M61 [Altererythrobacter sp. B11]|uniref:M61 family metallopeptidase n=1 Tax=Altererythrobacter sp. B11 TaxID=2060312 RepID=UPI000DC6E756|nr:M61 family metallopeptidase [Altererythrobacter sp. B11]BBC71752.1 peptidase M61 [Altererythrobacter sp. B11]